MFFTLKRACVSKRQFLILGVKRGRMISKYPYPLKEMSLK
ncbi:hypothetical protein HPHPH5B_0264 [Helicobacter pylori Hp H-5b]|nr:hypothetical protein HPHPH5B_0264 [Helicobacter pylori Hp H-5b]